MSQVYDYAVKRRDDECNTASEALYWAAYLDGVIAAQKEIEEIGKSCGGMQEIQTLRERLAAVSKERDELRAVVCQCSVCAGTGVVAVCNEHDHTAYFQRCKSCNGKGTIINPASETVRPKSITAVELARRIHDAATHPNNVFCSGTYEGAEDGQ